MLESILLSDAVSVPKSVLIWKWDSEVWLLACVTSCDSHRGRGRERRERGGGVREAGRERREREGGGEGGVGRDAGREREGEGEERIEKGREEDRRRERETEWVESK